MKYMSHGAREVLNACKDTDVTCELDDIVLFEILCTRYFPKTVTKQVIRDIKKHHGEPLPLSYFLTRLFNDVLKGAKIKDCPNVRLTDNVVVVYLTMSEFAKADFSMSDIKAIFWMGMNRELSDVKRAMKSAVSMGVYNPCYVKAIVSSPEYSPAKKIEAKKYQALSFDEKQSMDDILSKISDDKLME